MGEVVVPLWQFVALGLLAVVGVAVLVLALVAALTRGIYAVGAAIARWRQRRRLRRAIAKAAFSLNDLAESFTRLATGAIEESAEAVHDLADMMDDARRQQGAKPADPRVAPHGQYRSGTTH